MHFVHHRLSRWMMLLVMLLTAQPVLANRVEIEHGVRVAGLWCFPLHQRPDEWVYIPAAGRLATDANNNPQFSFVRYAINSPGDESSPSTITQAEGGGILHFLVMYDTPPEQVADAQKQLRDLKDNDAILIKSPIVFDTGRYTLVSSILEENGEKESNILATGSAPVLEGNQLALSFELDPEKAMLLMESFKMDTPDISLVFDLEFSGITDAYQAKVDVDWEEMRNNKAFSAGGTIYWVSADVGVEIDRLMRNNAIKMESTGNDANMEALIGRIYEKLLALLFEPAAPEQIPEDQRGDLTDALNSLIGQGKLLSSDQTTGFGAHVGYQLKDMRSEGTTVLDFNHRAEVQRHAYVTFNIGDLYKRYGDKPEVFRAVALSDPTFLQREVQVSVDGALLPEFEDMINSVTITLRKQHESGETTIRELVVDKNTFESQPGALRLVYGWHADNDREAWLNYEFRTRWSFKGGGRYQTPWRVSNGAMINLYAPYERRIIQVLNTGVDLAQEGVRAVIVQVKYPFFGITRRKQMVVRIGKNVIEPSVEITLPRDVFNYDYRMTWIMQNANRSHPHVLRSDGSGLVFLDPPPQLER